MQRLNRRRRDRGAVTVWVGVLMVPFLILCALSIDIAGANADRQRLQTGADAAALAIAQQCARGVSCTADGANGTADQLADANEPLGGAATGTAALRLSQGLVDVETTSTRQYLFGPVAGDGEAALSATAAAQWGYPTGGAHFPLAVSWCEILHFTGATPIRNASNQVIGLDIPPSSGSVTIYNKSNQAGNFHTCPAGTPMPPATAPNNTAPAGGFSWLMEGATGSCTSLQTAQFMMVASDTGNDTPDHCTAAQLRAMIGSSILVPVYDRTNGLTGSNAKYRIFGYVGFKLESFYFGSNYSSSPTATPPCGNPNRCIRGQIVEFVDLDDAITISPTGPQFGAVIVQLRLPEGG